MRIWKRWTTSRRPARSSGCRAPSSTCTRRPASGGRSWPGGWSAGSEPRRPHVTGARCTRCWILPGILTVRLLRRRSSRPRRRPCRQPDPRRPSRTPAVPSTESPRQPRSRDDSRRGAVTAPGSPVRARDARIPDFRASRPVREMLLSPSYARSAARGPTGSSGPTGVHLRIHVDDRHHRRTRRGR